MLGSLAEIAAWRGHWSPAILHVDTGMSRLGLDAGELAQLKATPSLLADIQVAYIMSHLVSSEAAHDPLNLAQHARFAEARRGLPAAPTSFANSSGIFLGPDYHFDLLRPGAALYGINPLPGRDNPMLPVVTLMSRILQVRRIDAFQTVGYGGAWRAARPSRVATIALGYADGYFRNLINRTHVHLAGHRIPVIGRISMDLVTIDVTDVPEALSQPGAGVEVLGPHLTPDHLADHARTNAYEVMTALGRRYARRYVETAETPEPEPAS